MPSDAAKQSASTRALGGAPRRDLNFATLGPHRPCTHDGGSRVPPRQAATRRVSNATRERGARGRLHQHSVSRDRGGSDLQLRRLSTKLQEYYTNLTPIRLDLFYMLGLIAPAIAAWVVVSGACTISNTICVRSPNYPNAYDDSSCVITPDAIEIVVSPGFEPECGYDYLTIDDTDYCEEAALTGLVPSGSDITWTSDGPNPGLKWEICYFVASPPLPPEPPPPPLPPFGPIGTFDVLSGPCTSVGPCVRSPNYPHNYPDDKACTLRPMGGVALSVTAGFKTYGSWSYDEDYKCNSYSDYLSIDGQQFCGSQGPDGIIPSGADITWYTDGMGYSVNVGWEREC